VFLVHKLRPENQDWSFCLEPERSSD